MNGSIAIAVLMTVAGILLLVVAADEIRLYIKQKNLDRKGLTTSDADDKEVAK